MKRTGQLSLRMAAPPSWGGKRRGAGRKPKGPRAGESHAIRPEHEAAHPVHVVFRVREHVWNLRSRRSFRVVEHALRGVVGRPGFRVVHYSVQGNHLHLLAEASDAAALSSGCKALAVRLALGLNRMMNTRGPVLADRFHARALRTPREVRNALAYVLLNHDSHMVRIGSSPASAGVDPFSSGGAFDGWAREVKREDVRVGAADVTSAPREWLLATGWRRHGLLSPEEILAVPRQVMVATADG
jgi:REP-associated tyrosine transposase